MRALELGRQCRARNVRAFVPMNLVDHAETGGMPGAEAIPDNLLPEEQLLLAAQYTAAGDVKLCRQAHERAQTLPFGGALDFQAMEGTDDPLRADAVLCIALGVDRER